MHEQGKSIGRNDEAVTDYNESLRLRPEHAPTYYNWASAYRKMGNTDRAIDDYRKALQIDPAMELARTRLRELGAI
jgi:tetratricopeptide (TPR) repeat protein